MRRYLEALASLTGRGDSPAASVTPVPSGDVDLPVVVAALGPRMVELAGRFADGVVLWCMGPNAIGTIAEPLRTAARGTGRPPPRLVVSMPVCVTEDARRARERIDRRFGAVDELASYRRALALEPAASLAEIASVGTESEVISALRRLEDAGATEFAAVVTTSTKSEYEATIEVLARFTGTRQW